MQQLVLTYSYQEPHARAAAMVAFDPTRLGFTCSYAGISLHKNCYAVHGICTALVVRCLALT
eukprot:518745-Rhodomonas_salina.10